MSPFAEAYKQQVARLEPFLREWTRFDLPQQEQYVHALSLLLTRRAEALLSATREAREDLLRAFAEPDRKLRALAGAIYETMGLRVEQFLDAPPTERIPTWAP